MEERDVVYLAGLVDGVGSFEVSVSPHDNYATGFRFEPKIRLTLRNSDQAVLGLLDEYCEEIGIQYSIEDREDTESVRFVVQNPDHITRFIDPFGGLLIRKHENALMMVDEIIPAVKEGKHQSKQGLYDLMEHVEKLRAGTGRNPKYNQEWFAEEWDLPE